MRLRHAGLLAVALVAFGTGVARASVATTTTLTGFSHITVDGAHGHVFVTGDSSDNSIAVMNADGTADTTITGEPGAGAMALSADGSTLYVQLRGQDQVDEIDTTSLTDVGHFTASVKSTWDITLGNGRLWYSNDAGSLASVSLDSSHAELPTSIAVSYGAELQTTVAHPTWLLLGELNTPTVALVDITDPGNVTQTASFTDTPGGYLRDMATSPDGSKVVASFGYPNALVALTLPTLTKGVRYNTGNSTGIAISPGSGRVAAANDDSFDTYLVVYSATGTVTAPTRIFANTGGNNSPHFLAFSANGDFIYAVTPSSTTGDYVFHAVQTLPLTSAQFSFKSPATTITYGLGVTLTAHIGFATTNRTVQIYRQPVGTSTPVLTATGTVGASGNYSYVAHPSQNTVYSVRWGGDTTHLPVTQTRSISVRLVMHRETKGGYATSSGYRLYHYSGTCGTSAHTGCPTFQAWTSPLQPGRTMSYLVQGKTTSGSWVTIAKGGFPTSAGGQLVLVLTYKGTGLVGVDQRVRFSMASNSLHVGATSTWLAFRITK